MTDYDPNSNSLIRKHEFAGVEGTRHMAAGSLDPAQIRQRMEARATDLEYDEDDPASEVAKIIDRVKKQHAAMVASSGALDDELAAADMES
jgi:hypothetical protein